MKFLIDAQLPPGLCGWLEARGHEAEHVFDLGMAGAADAQVAQRAKEAGAILISKDEDFLTLQSAMTFQLLWLRCGNVTNRVLAEWLETRWERIEEPLGNGEALVEVR